MSDEVLKVVIHYVTNFFNLKVLNPAVCLYVIDQKTGTYAKKSDRKRPVVSFYEIQRNDLDYIMPIMTQPCSVCTDKSSFTLKWEEAIILNEKTDVFLNKNSNIIFFFEIIDVAPVSVIKYKYERLNPGKMKKLAWAFLKVHGLNKSFNFGSKLCLQLYKPGKSHRRKKFPSVEVYDWWLKKPQASLAASLFVSLEPFHPVSVEPALRSMLPIQQETGSVFIDQLIGFQQESPSLFRENFDKENSKTSKETPVKWSRKAGEPCTIPTKKFLTLDVINSCQVLKFSHSGRFLAVGCGSQGCYYLMIYQIPEGNVLQKFIAHPELIHDLDWSCNDKCLLSASGDYNVKLWNPNHWSSVSLLVHPSFVYSAKFHPFNNVLASACYDHIVRIWDVKKHKLLLELESHKSTVCCLSWNAVGTKLYSADGLGQIKVWSKMKKGDVYDLRSELSHPDIQGVSISKIIVDNQEANLILFCSDSFVRILDIYEKKISVLESDVPLPKFLKGCSSPCFNLIFLNNLKGDVSVWNKDSGVNSFRSMSYNLNNGTISCIEYHPHEHMIALGFQEDSVPIHIYVNETLDAEDFDAGESRESKLPTLTECSRMKHDITQAEFSLKDTKNKKGNMPRSDFPAVITKKEQFDVIAVTDKATYPESCEFRTINYAPGDPNKHCKRSIRRQKLRELSKHIGS